MNLTRGQLDRISRLGEQWSLLWDKRRRLWIAAEDAKEGTWWTIDRPAPDGISWPSLLPVGPDLDPARGNRGPCGHLRCTIPLCGVT